MSLLVTGGAGYVGSAMVSLLVKRGIDVVVIDHLESGHREALPRGVPLLVSDISDRERVESFVHEHRVSAVLHFAARIQVGESVKTPRRYWIGNVVASAMLLEVVLDAGIRDFVFSSTAAVYGDPIHVPIDEDHPTHPMSPYGETKLAIERMLENYGRAYGLRWAALRYFNASGSDPDGSMGEKHDPETHLLPLAIDAALGKRPHLEIYGDDWPTPDGTCIRDYIHVLDLAEAHLAAIAHLRRGGESGAFNLGTGTGHSVKEIVSSIERETGKRVPVRIGARRPGDPPVLVASPERAARVLGFRATRSSIDRIVHDAARFAQ